MKKYIVRIVLYFSIIAVIDLGFGFIGDYLQTHAKGGVTRRINDLVLNDVHDIIIMGSSRAHRHYDAQYLSDALGLDVYNAGVEGNGIILAYGFLELILERYRPKLIIYEVTSAFDIYENIEDNKNERYISSLKPYYRHEAIGDEIYDISQNCWYEVHSGLVRYNTNLITLFLDYNRIQNDDKKGFAPLSGTLSDTITSKKNNQKLIIDTLKLKYIKKMIKLAQSKNVPIVFVKSPRYEASNSDELKPICEICNKMNVPYFDYRCDEKFQKKYYFHDRGHLNAKGAFVFSSEIANLIKKQKIVLN